jgi:hypothetical protein
MALQATLGLSFWRIILGMKRAWVIRWEYYGSVISDIAAQHEVVAILPYSWGHNRVKDVLERLYKERALTIAEKAHWQNAKSGPYKVQNMAYIHRVPVVGHYYSIGHEPELVAHQAIDIKIDGLHSISWGEPAPKHLKWMCEEVAREPECELKDKEPYIKRLEYRQF